MSINDLSQQVDAFHDWKRQLSSSVERYKQWLVDAGLYSNELDARLQRGLGLLHDELLTVALVGEYSRGKTELINALVFSSFGQRMLPSQAGRTTMCPTEIFYDQHQKKNYLKLLPIDSRSQNQTISELKKSDHEWRYFPIDPRNQESMAETLRQIAETRVVSFAQARELGFDEGSLERAKNSDKVLIPAWRHALLSLDSPILRKGLCILDTPGLNALGSEPELTISMIPNAQAVIFMLSADTGVTASDMAIWKQYIDVHESEHRAGRFAVLNKIDVLWDDLQGEPHISASIEQIRHLTAKQLNMDAEDVLPLSAKQGLIAKIRKDHSLLQKSAFPKLEKLISKRIIAERESTIYKDLLRDLQKMLHGSQSVLNDRLANLYERHEGLEREVLSPEMLQNLAKETHTEHDIYHRKLITLRSSRRLMESQGEVLQQLVSEERLKEVLKHTKRDMQDCWSTVGLVHSMNKFFDKMDKELDNVESEAKIADKMVHAIYKRFKSDVHAKYLKPRKFTIGEQRKALEALKAKLVKFCRRPKMFMTEQSVLINHFFNTFAAEMRLIQLQIIKQAKQWPEEALLPLIQYTHEQKTMLEERVSHLRNLA
ncbi:dynamin family protein, partial [Oleiphilus sp. HI0086]